MRLSVRGLWASQPRVALPACGGGGCVPSPVSLTSPPLRGGEVRDPSNSTPPPKSKSRSKTESQIKAANRAARGHNLAASCGTGKCWPDEPGSRTGTLVRSRNPETGKGAHDVAPPVSARCPDPTHGRALRATTRVAEQLTRNSVTSSRCVSSMPLAQRQRRASSSSTAIHGYVTCRRLAERSCCPPEAGHSLATLVDG